MKTHEYTQGSVFPKKYLVKRKVVKDQTTLANGSIFSVVTKQMSDFTQGDTLKNYQTMTTNVDNTATIHTNMEESLSNQVKTQHQFQQILPKILRSKQIKSLNKSILQPEQSPVPRKNMSPKQHFSHHISDPFYMRLEKKHSVRVQDKFNDYKKGWMQYCMRRKEKSVVEQSLQKANQTIEHIQTDARKRRNTTQLEELVRNNILEKTFIFPAKFKAQLEGLKGKGGKVLPLYQENYMCEEVYKIDRGHR